VLARIFGAERFTPEQLDQISYDKEVEYQRIYRPHLDLLPGLFSFMQNAKEAHISMAIGSAAMPFNIDFVLDNLKIGHYFNAVVSADDVAHSKPHPETFLLAARRLNVEPASCIVFEDAPKGVEAAERAGMKAIVLTTVHEPSEFKQYNNILSFAPDYTALSAQVIGDMEIAVR
jgi:HAD superfamily hydrolase (TIGR01509 family)